MSATVAVRRIEPRGALTWRGLGELWAYRELLYFLVWRDLKVRYKQTALGAAWAVLQPVLAMIVFTIFFGRLAHMPSDGVPYPLFSMCALVPWTYFATALTNGSQSLIGQQHVITKVYFPRLLVPVASVVAPLVDLAIAFVVLLGMIVSYGVVPPVEIVFVPLFVLLGAASAAAGAVWLAALTVRFRDVRYVLPFAVQIWMFATPVVYPASLVPESFRPLYGLNPMVGVIEGFRWAMLGAPAPGTMTLMSAVVVCVGLVGATAYFRRVEGTIVDVL